MIQRPTHHFSTPSVPSNVKLSFDDDYFNVRARPSLDACVRLDVPPLEELSNAIADGLSTHFAQFIVTVETCPDLTQAPYNCACEGLGTDASTVVDVGGPGNLFPVLRKKIYDVRDVIYLAGRSGQTTAASGPGAGPYHLVGTNCEMTCTCLVPAPSYENATIATQIAKIDPLSRRPVVHPVQSTQFALMANLLLTNGQRGDVIRIRAKRRIGETNFPNAVRAAVRARYGSRHVTMAGVFTMQNGAGNVHVMPDFPENGRFDEESDIENKWLRFFVVNSTLVCHTVFHSDDYKDLRLRVEHTHGYSSTGDGGHYHNDTAADTVVYDAVLVPAHYLLRMDKC